MPSISRKSARNSATNAASNVAGCAGVLSIHTTAFSLTESTSAVIVSRLAPTGTLSVRVVPTADLSITMGLSLGVLIVCLIYNVKIKGLGGWVHELFSAPFGDKWFLYPINFLMQMIEFVAKTVSHGMRLFGNMYAGELIFMLIALMGGAFALTGTGIALFLGHIVAGTVWAAGSTSIWRVPKSITSPTWKGCKRRIGWSADGRRVKSGQMAPLNRWLRSASSVAGRPCTVIGGRLLLRRRMTLSANSGTPSTAQLVVISGR